MFVVGRRFVAVAVVVTALSACALRPAVSELKQVEPASGYRWTHRDAVPENDPGTLLILTFSGGGTRAAAFSYGVLEELRRTPLSTARGSESNALAQIDLITGTSGGSFTALAYALHGEQLFGFYEQAFLKRDVQRQLIERLLNPLVWPKVLSQGFGRSELAGEYYDEILFKGATFADLARRAAPMTLVGATDVSTGHRIDFSQTQFDAMCLDLGAMPLSRAAAASSAVPGVLSPVTLDNHGGTCGFRPPPWMVEAARAPREQLLGNRADARLRQIASLGDAAARPYIHLVDGGLSDNLGLVSVVQALHEMMDNPAYRNAMLSNGLQRIAIVVVNARSAPTLRFDQEPVGPTTLQLLTQAVRVPMDRYSTESVAALRDAITEWRERARIEADDRLQGRPEPPGGSLPAVRFFVSEVSFDAVDDAALRVYLQNLPTSFFLSDEAVDRLRETAARLLRESPAFAALLADLRAHRAPPGPSSSTPR
jgi:NTE family protein